MPNDIFENKILCKNCEKPMKSGLITKNGFNLRIMKCEKCGEVLVHPADKTEYENFMRLKQKEFEVKMRMVGNSYAVSIPREIVDFMQEQEKHMNNMVRLCFEDMGRLSLNFGMPKAEMNEESENPQNNSRVVRAKEVKIVKNGKPVLHTKQFYDSAHPERNKNLRFVKKINSENEEDEE